MMRKVTVLLIAMAVTLVAFGESQVRGEEAKQGGSFLKRDGKVVNAIEFDACMRPSDFIRGVFQEQTIEVALEMVKELWFLEDKDYYNKKGKLRLVMRDGREFELDDATCKC